MTISGFTHLRWLYQGKGELHNLIPRGGNVSSRFIMKIRLEED